MADLTLYIQSILPTFPRQRMEVQDIDFVFGIGGNDKKNSSSEMMKRFITLEKKKEKIYE